MLFADLKAWTEDRTQDLHITSVMHYHCAIQAHLRQPGIEPGPLAWKASILTTGLLALND